MYRQQNEGDRIVFIVLGIIFLMGFIILLAQSLVIPLLIIGFVILVIGLRSESNELVSIGIILLLGSFISLVIGFIFGGSEIGKMSIGFFNTTMSIVKSYPLK